jgi:hypothetical protein
MKTFRWRSDALKQYGQGHIIVLAANAEEARAKAKAQVDPWIRENREFMLPEFNSGDEDDYNALVALFEADIAGEPEEIETLFISGSE